MPTSPIEVIGIGNVHIGDRTSIAAGVQVVFHRPATLTIGDYCSLGAGVKFICDGGDVELGDWTTLHDRCLVLSTEGVRIGQHGWFGQNCVIDGSGGLSTGSGVRVGMYSQIWSHVAAGEQIEGCTLFSKRPVVIEDDVWLVGSCIVASGVTLGKRTVALIASNITKSWPAYSVLAGSPAALKPNLNFYRDIGLEEKWRLLSGWLQDASRTLNLKLLEAGPDQWILQGNGQGEIAFVKSAEHACTLRASDGYLTVCCIEDKSYNKRINDTEWAVLKFLAGNKARFRAC